VVGFINFLLIRWTQHSEHDNFAQSIAGTPPGLNIDLTLTAATEDTLRRQVKKPFAFNHVENQAILTIT